MELFDEFQGILKPDDSDTEQPKQNIVTPVSLTQETTEQISTLLSLRFRLQEIHTNVLDIKKSIKSTDDHFNKLQQKSSEILLIKQDNINLNIGGKIFQTKIPTLLAFKDTLFYNIIVKSFEDDSEMKTKELFFDRSYTHFDFFLSYMRTKQYSLKGYRRYQLEEIARDAEYYGFKEISDDIELLLKEVRIVKMESSKLHPNCGSGKIEDLNDESLQTGICTNYSPYFITFELDFEHEFDCIDIAGYDGKKGTWYANYGASCNIMTSMDKKNWKNVGNLPYDYGAKIQTVKLKLSSAKYLKFQHNSYIGIGYLKIRKS